VIKGCSRIGFFVFFLHVDGLSAVIKTAMFANPVRQLLLVAFGARHQRG
jgi:hypothetical protein